ncbi:MAG: PD40 domain-containing protein, partial [Nitrospirae bacterium]|nr:PD40 domain-containing protein [Nitrospirota bacterium]
NGRTDIFVHDLRDRVTVRVSVADDGTEGNHDSGSPTISRSGRHVVFESAASNLVPGDTNGQPDIFLYDLETRRIRRVSLDSAGRQANGDSFDPWVSADGSAVVFASDADNLVPDDTNRKMDVFLRDLKTGKTVRISLTPEGGQRQGDSYSPSISDDGRVVTYTALNAGPAQYDLRNKADVFWHDLKTGKTFPASVASDGRYGDHHSKASWISGDGRALAFQSYAGNLVSDDTNGRPDIFLRDLPGAVTVLVSAGEGRLPSNGENFFPSLDASGRRIAFYSYATNLVPGDANRKSDVFVWEGPAGRVRRVSLGFGGDEADGASFSPAISGDGRAVVFLSAAANLVPGDSNGRADAFVAQLP